MIIHEWKESPSTGKLLSASFLLIPFFSRNRLFLIRHTTHLFRIYLLSILFEYSPPCWYFTIESSWTCPKRSRMSLCWRCFDWRPLWNKFWNDFIVEDCWSYSWNLRWRWWLLQWQRWKIQACKRKRNIPPGKEPLYILFENDLRESSQEPRDFYNEIWKKEEFWNSALQTKI